LILTSSLTLAPVAAMNLTAKYQRSSPSRFRQLFRYS
jgi:hypothetical protein